jgi:Zn-dependent protease
MALAGPAANLALVLIAVGLIRLGIMADLFYAPPSISFGRVVGTDLGQLWPAAARMVGILFSLNLLLCLFNLLPFPPLDGSGALPLVLSPTATRRYQDLVMGNSVLSLIGILVAWQLFPRLFEPVFFGAVRLVFPGMGYH